MAQEWDPVRFEKAVSELVEDDTKIDQHPGE